MEKKNYNADDVVKELEVSKSQAYKIIRGLRVQLSEEKRINIDLLPAGRIPAKYFLEKFGLI